MNNTNFCDFSSSTECSKCGYVPVKKLPILRVCNTVLPSSQIEPQYHTPCKHLQESTGEEVAVICITCQGKRSPRMYSLYNCAIHGECLPDFQCTKESKEATAEWMEKNGLSVQIAVCYGCKDHIVQPT